MATTTVATHRRTLRFSLRTLLLFVMSIGGAAALWLDWPSWVLEKPIADVNDVIWSADYSPDGRKLAAVSENKSIRICDAETGATLIEIRTGKGRTYCPRFSSNGRCISAICDDTSIRGWNAANGAQLFALPIPRGCDCMPSPDAQRVATALDGNLSLVDVRSGAVLLSATNTVGFSQPFFSPDGKYLAAIAGNRDNLTAERVLEVWDTAARKLCWTKSGNFRAAIFTGDGQHLVASYDGGVVEILAANNGNLDVSQKMNGYCHSICDLQHILIDTGQETKVWNAISNQVLATVPGSPFDYQGRGLFHASASDRLLTFDWTDDARMAIYLSNPTSGERLATLYGGDAAPITCTLTPDGRHVIAECSAGNTGKNGIIRMWRRRRPEALWGIAWLPEFWLTLVLAVALPWSIWLDSRGHVLSNNRTRNPLTQLRRA